MRNRVQRGFTLIELVVVITILGILAAFAVPRFIALEGKAREAAINGIAGSLRSASALSHGMWLASGSPATISMEGQTIAMTFGYPSSAAIVTTLADTSGFSSTPTPTTTNTFTKDGATTPANCSVIYTAATSATVPATVSIPVVTGC